MRFSRTSCGGGDLFPRGKIENFPTTPTVILFFSIFPFFYKTRNAVYRHNSMGHQKNRKKLMGNSANPAVGVIFELSRSGVGT